MDLSNENVIHIKKGDNEYLQFRKLLEYQDLLSHAYSLGTDVNYRVIKPNGEALDEEDYKKALYDYDKLCNEIKVDYKNIVRPKQNHTDRVKIVDRKIEQGKPDFNLEQYTNTDGLITNKKDLILSTTNADCILLLFFDPVKKVIANVHSGWKGTVQRISIKTVGKMVDEYGCDPKDIICCMCPSIRKCHFEVGKDVKDMFENEFKDLDISNSIELMEKQNDKEKWNIDTILINRLILEKEGLLKENIIDSGICSVCNSNLIHSYRVEKEKYGLGTALIGLK